MGGEKRRTVSLVVVGSKLICTDSCCGCKASADNGVEVEHLRRPGGRGMAGQIRTGAWEHRVSSRWPRTSSPLAACRVVPAAPARRRGGATATGRGPGMEPTRRGEVAAEPVRSLACVPRPDGGCCFADSSSRSRARLPPHRSRPGTLWDKQKQTHPSSGLDYKSLPPALRPGPAPSSRSDFRSPASVLSLATALLPSWGRKVNSQLHPLTRPRCLWPWDGSACRCSASVLQ